MDLSKLSEKDQKKMMELVEAKQAQQFMKLYTYTVNRCFDDCIKDFTSNQMSSKEDACVTKCTDKLLKQTNRIGQRMAEKQMIPTQENI